MALIHKLYAGLDYLNSKLFPNQKSSTVEGRVICNVSPFTSQYNSMILEYARLQREGATDEQLKTFVRSYRIISSEGQWKVPDRFPSLDENLRINALALDDSAIKYN